jgi:hypothetical protein
MKKQFTLCYILLVSGSLCIGQFNKLPSKEIPVNKEIKTTNTYSTTSQQAGIPLRPGEFMDKTPVLIAPYNNSNISYYYPAAIDLLTEGVDAQYYFSDINGDTNDEILAIGNKTKNTIVLQLTNNTISRKSTYPLPDDLRSYFTYFFGKYSIGYGNNLLVYSANSYSFTSYQFNSTAHWILDRPYQILSNWTYTHDIYSGDFNGDGKSDLLAWDKGSNQWYVALYESNRSFKGESGLIVPKGTWLKDWAQTKDMQCVVGDFNGDGKDDIALLHQPSGEWWVATSTGLGFQPTQGYKYGVWLKPWATGTHQQIFAIDVNNDGMCDLLKYDPTERSFQAVLSNGQYFDYYMKKEYIDPSIKNPMQVIAGKYNQHALIGIVHDLPVDNYSISRRMMSLYYTNYRK